jgi:hypothetical protein
MSKRGRVMYCKDRSMPIEKDCPDCVDALYEWAQLAKKRVAQLEGAIERLTGFASPGSRFYSAAGLCRVRGEDLDFARAMVS